MHVWAFGGLSAGFKCPRALAEKIEIPPAPPVLYVHNLGNTHGPAMMEIVATADLLDEYARAAGYGSYANVPETVKNLHYTHVGSIFQPQPVRITSREFYTPYPELFEARWGMPLPAEAVAEYNAMRAANNEEAARRAAACGVGPVVG